MIGNAVTLSQVLNFEFETSLLSARQGPPVSQFVQTSMSSPFVTYNLSNPSLSGFPIAQTTTTLTYSLAAPLGVPLASQSPPTRFEFASCSSRRIFCSARGKFSRLERSDHGGYSGEHSIGESRNASELPNGIRREASKFSRPCDQSR